MVREFLRWWLGQLGDVFPEQYRRYYSRAADVVIVAPLAPTSNGVEEVVVSLRHGGRETTLGQFRLGDEQLAAEMPRLAGKQAVLRLGEVGVLGKTLVLPLATERQLDEVLAFEMDRETPFTADEVFWSHRVAQRDRRTGQIWVRLLLIPRLRLAGLLEALNKVGIRPWRAEIAAGPDKGGAVSLDVEARHDLAGRRMLRPALACCVLLALAAGTIPFARQAWMLTSVERAISADRAGALEAGKLRQEIDRLSGSADLIERERSKGGGPLAILAALTGLLPMDTYLTDFAQQQGKVTLTGRSAGASRLIAVLAKAEPLRSPTFAAPVTRIGANQLEIFTITAEIAP